MKYKYLNTYLNPNTHFCDLSTWLTAIQQTTSVSKKPNQNQQNAIVERSALIFQQLILRLSNLVDVVANLFC